ALEKEPARRYDSASALAADLTRYLKNETILARRIGVPGRMTRWVRRNRAVSIVGTVSVLILATTSVVLVNRIVRENHRANRALSVLRDNLSRIKSLFGSMDANNQTHGLMDVGQIFDNAAKRLDSSPPAFPESEADFREFLGEGYRQIGLYSKAIVQQ